MLAAPIQHTQRLWALQPQTGLIRSLSAKARADMAAASPDAFMGTWYIAHSTLDVWKGGKQNARVVTTREGPTTWSDVSTYEQLNKKGEVETNTIRSWNVQAKDDPKGFTWSIRGALFWIRCKCKVLDHDEALQDYAVVLFGKSLITKPGLDIYSRTNQDLPADKLAAILAKARTLDPAVGQILDSQELVAVKKTDSAKSDVAVPAAAEAEAAAAATRA